MSRGGRPLAEGGDPAGLMENVRAAVEAHEPADPREAQAKQCVLGALRDLERPFDENAGPVHVTGSAIVVGPRGTVLHVHKRLKRWLQPGGHIDPGEGPWDAALRESQEETGLTLAHPDGGPRLIHVDVHPAANGHTHHDLRYLLVAPDEEPSPPPGESPAARWFSWDEALAVADDALVGALRAAMRQPEVQAWTGSDAGPRDIGPEVAVGKGRRSRQNGTSEHRSVTNHS